MEIKKVAEYVEMAYGMQHIFMSIFDGEHQRLT